MKTRTATMLYCLFLAVPGLAPRANEADVIDVAVSCDEQRMCSFNVTVNHKDRGWDHYANSWEVLDENRKRLGRRELAHPHVNEQPFTRSLEAVEIPDEVKQVTIRASDSRHRFGGAEVTVVIPD